MAVLYLTACGIAALASIKYFTAREVSRLKRQIREVRWEIKQARTRLEEVREHSAIVQDKEKLLELRVVSARRVIEDLASQAGRATDQDPAVLPEATMAASA